MEAAGDGGAARSLVLKLMLSAACGGAGPRMDPRPAPVRPAHHHFLEDRPMAQQPGTKKPVSVCSNTPLGGPMTAVYEARELAMGAER